MPDESGDFRYSDVPEPHRSRTKAILRDHPEVRKLFGPNIWSFAVIVGVVGFQYTVAYLLREQPWWVIVAVAWCVGVLQSRHVRDDSRCGA